MNSWNSELVASLYQKQVLGYVTVIGDEVRLQSSDVAQEFRRLVREEGANPHDPSTLTKSRSSPHPAPSDPGTGSPLPYVLLWLSELGRKTELDGLLRYLDRHQKPTWENGGLFYSRNDTETNEDGSLAQVGPLAGNACAAYARLNVHNGQKIMWERSWTGQDLSTRPWIDNVTLSQVDCLRGMWDNEAMVLILTVRTWENRRVQIQPTAQNLDAGLWAVYVDGELLKYDNVEAGGLMVADVEVGTDEVDIVFKKV